jgi:histidine triad (HIT) family protein
MVNPEDLQNMSPEKIAEMQKQQCIFCKIISGEIPSKKVYENDNAVVILDINPVNDGHCLVIPKKHYQIMPQIPSSELGKLFELAKKTSHSLLKGLSMEGTTIFVANGATAGQKAPHFMVHVIPRKKGDGLFYIPKNKIETEKLDELNDKLVKKFSTKKPQVEQPKQIEHKKVKEPSEEKKSEIHTEETDTKNPDLESLAQEDNTEGEVEEKPDEESVETKKSKKKNEIDIDKISDMFM